MIKTNFLNFLLLIVTIKKISTSRENSYYILTDANFDTYINPDEKNTKWLIVFYVDKCNFCNQTIKILKDEIIPYYSKNKNIKFGTINCDKNLWSAIRFNLSYTPYVILIENNKYYQFKTFPGKEAFINFIDEEKTVEDSLNIPKKISMIQKGLKIFKGFASEITKTIQDYLDSNNYNFKWDIKYSMALIIGSTLIVIGLEILILFGVTNCLFGNKKNKGKNKKNKIKKEKEDKKENNNNKKENNKKDDEHTKKE